MSGSSSEYPVHISPRRLGHANLLVNDLERSQEFYTQVCGLEVVLRQPSIRAAFFSNGNTHHDIGMIEATPGELYAEDGKRIFAAGQAAVAGLNHLGWEMESEFSLVQAWRRLNAASYRVNRTVRHISSNSFYLSDPDGNVHEFYADVSKDWRRLYAEDNHLSRAWSPGEQPPSTDTRYHENPEIHVNVQALVPAARFSHVVLHTHDTGSMRDFFANTIGLVEQYASPRGGFHAFGAPACRYPVVVALVAGRKSGERSKAVHHFAFEVASEQAIEEGERRLKAAGIDVHFVFDEAHKRSLYVANPDGTHVEFFFKRSDSISFDRLDETGQIEFRV